MVTYPWVECMYVCFTTSSLAILNLQSWNSGPGNNEKIPGYVLDCPFIHFQLVICAFTTQITSFLKTNLKGGVILYCTLNFAI